MHITIPLKCYFFYLDKRIDYYGDPLRDFGLAHFLERFSFKNPKKLDAKSDDTAPLSHRPYVSYGARGVPVKSLTKNNCSEEEMFIFNYLEEKRKLSGRTQKSKKSEDSDEEDESTLKAGDVDDDEFEDYLDGFFGKKKKSKKSLGEDNSEDEELDFLKDLGGEASMDTKEKKTQRKKKNVEIDDNDEDIDGDWDDEDDDGNADFEGGDNSDDEEGSIDFNEDEDEDDGDDDDDVNGGGMDNEDDDDDDDDDMNEFDGSSDDDLSGADSDDAPPSKSKKLKRDGSSLDERSFAKKLKHSDGKLCCFCKISETTLIKLLYFSFD